MNDLLDDIDRFYYLMGCDCGDCREVDGEI